MTQCPGALGNNLSVLLHGVDTDFNRFLRLKVLLPTAP